MDFAPLLLRIDAQAVVAAMLSAALRLHPLASSIVGLAITMVNIEGPQDTQIKEVEAL
jgi:hypothetical protein